MTAYLPYLTEIPDSAFTSKSAEFVAMHDRAEKVPDLAELKDLLQTWVLSRAPKREQADAGMPQAGLTPADESWLETWHRHQSSGFRDTKGCPVYHHLASKDPRDHLRHHVASMIRQYAPGAWARISAGQA